ncbi:hypothetical protein UlMin_039571 [Ulmus minor]
MESFDFNIVRAGKPSPMKTYNRIIRIAELFFALIFLFWIFARLPSAVEISGEYLRLLSDVITSSLFVFLFCNAIIVSLIANSGRFSAQNQSGSDTENAIYDRMAKDRAKSPSENDNASIETDETVFEDKQVISEVNATAVKDHEIADTNSDSDSNYDLPRSYRRWKSENFERTLGLSEDLDRTLRRSESENCRDIVLAGKEDLSDEEFKRTVDAFIAKQLRFRREEDDRKGYGRSEVPGVCVSYPKVAAING